MTIAPICAFEMLKSRVLQNILSGLSASCAGLPIVTGIVAVYNHHLSRRPALLLFAGLAFAGQGAFTSCRLPIVAAFGQLVRSASVAVLQASESRKARMSISSATLVLGRRIRCAVPSDQLWRVPDGSAGCFMISPSKMAG